MSDGNIGASINAYNTSLDISFDKVYEVDKGLPVGVIANPYSSTQTYAPGDYVIYKSKLYRCIVAIEEPEEFDIEKWTQVKLANEVQDLAENLDTKADKSTTYTKSEVDEIAIGKANISDVETALAQKADKEDTYTKSQVDSALSLKANSSNVYTKSQTYTKDETDDKLALKADKSTTYTKTEIDTKFANLPAPMIFKGTLGVGGTIQSLPIASASNEGYTYKVITDGTYAGQTAKVGDVFTSNGSAWVYIPSGDEDNDTWRAIKVNGVEKLGNGISSGAVDFEDTANVKFEFDANGNKVRARLDGIYTESEVDDLLDDKADADNTYTKEQVDDIVYNILPDDMASGSVANFTTSLELPLKSLKVDVNAVQDLHGQSGAYPAGGSAQKWDEETVNGYLSSTDGSFISNNTSICSKNFNSILSNTDYFLFKGSSTPATYICLYDTNQEFIKRESIAGVKITTPNNAAYFKVSCYGYGATYKNDIGINYPATDTAYHPYSNICPISGVSEINITKCRLNLVDIKPIEEWEYSSAYYLLFNSVPNKQVQMSFIDNDTSVDVSDINIGFVDSNYNKVSALTPQQYRWCLTSGGVQTNRTNLSVQGNNILTGLMIYPKTEDVFSRLFARYKIVISINNETTYEPYNGSTTLINLGGTYYGGHFTQDKDGHRQFEVTHSNITDLGSFTWNNSAEGYTQSPIIEGMKKTASGSTIPDMLCDTLKVDTPSNVYNKVTDGSISIAITTANSGLRVYMSTLAGLTASQVKSALSGIYIAYPLETPYTIDLPDGEPIITLNGTNNIYADTGDCAVEYKVSIEQYVSNHSGGGRGGLGGAKSGGSEEEPTEEIQKLNTKNP